MAHVHVVIIGLSRKDEEPAVKRLFSYSKGDETPAESQHAALTPYLFDAGTVVNRHLVVEETSRPLASVPRMVIGSKPIDDGNYIFDREQREEFLHRERGAGRYLNPYVGSEEFINGGERWILNLSGASPEELRALPLLRERIAAVRAFRSQSRSPATRELAQTPARFHVTVVPDGPFLVIPKVSSERREYVPIGWMEPPVIPSDLVFVLREADLWHFGILTSTMHMAWLRQIGGRLESRYRYSIGIVYNPFPWPEADDAQRAKIRTLGQAILAARRQYPDSTLADLYDPDVMPQALRQAHNRLDKAVDRLYRGEAFLGDRDRVEHLFGLYERLIAPLIALAGQRVRRARRS